LPDNKETVIVAKPNESPADAYLRAGMAGLLEYCGAHPVKTSAGESKRTTVPLGANCPVEMFAAAVDAAANNGVNVRIDKTTGVASLMYNAQSLAVLTAFDVAFRRFYTDGWLWVPGTVGQRSGDGGVVKELTMQLNESDASFLQLVQGGVITLEQVPATRRDIIAGLLAA